MAYKRKRVYRKRRRVRRRRPYMRRRGSRRSYRRFRRSNTRITRKRLGILPADQAFIKFRGTGYAGYQVAAGNNVVAAAQQVKGNSFLFPFGGTDTLRPLIIGQSNYYQWYNQYQITGCKITATFFNQSANPLYCYLLPGQNPINPSSGFEEVIVNQPYCRKKILAPQAQGYRNNVRLSHYMPTAKIFGTALTTTDDDYTGNFSGAISGPTTDPIHLYYFYIGLCTVDGSYLPTGSLIGSVVFTVTWYTRLFKKANIA